MMKRIHLYIMSLFLTAGMLQAQAPLAIPNNSFEQWTTHPGYSVNVFIMNLPVYDNYSTPNSWDYPKYHINQSVNVMGMNININTDIPLVKASEETSSVPVGNKAVKLQTFMIDEIINSTMLSLAGDYIDTSLIQEVIPSILSTGDVDLEAFIPIITSVMTDTADITSMIPSLLGMDVNEYISGGLALNGFRPGYLSGSYKYHSGTNGDNGGVILLGTHYNNITHQRDIVGGGINLDLTDTGVYSYFEAEYVSLHELMPEMPNIAPDTLVIMLVSSASENRQQGSYLCMDNLTLWPAAITCPDIMMPSVEAGIHDALVSWNDSDSVEGYELEYGASGFTLGTGIEATTTATSFTLEGLESNTTYDVYIRSVCSDSLYGEWSFIEFTTYGDTCASVLNLAITTQVYDAFPQMVLEWNGSSQPDHWEVEYGPQGFEHGTGTVVETNEPSFEIYTLENDGTLNPNTWYDFHVRSVCGDDVFGEWDSVHYRTFCAKVSNPEVNSDNIQVTSDDKVYGYSISWDDNTETSRWSVYYGIFNQSYPDQPWGTYVEVDTPYFEFPPLMPEKTYTVEISALCDEHNYGEIVLAYFTTQRPVGIEEPQQSIVNQLTISPNPSHGQCIITTRDNQAAQLKLYSADGRLIEVLNTDGTPVTLELPWQGFFLLHATTPYGTSTYKIVNK